MSDTSLGLIDGRQRGNWIRLRTLILLRWAAIIGQIAALLIGQKFYGLKLEIGLCYMVIGLSVIANLAALFIFPETKRLTERENFLTVLFDLLQLCALLYLTGGLHNPFTILVVGPVTMSAAALSTRSTVVLGAIAILLVTLLARFHLPLETTDGFVLQVGDLFVFGNWIAIVISIVFLAVYARWIASESHSMSDALQATQMALAREQKLTDLGGVVAAAAHEMGTPLATIKLTSSELMEDLKDSPDLLEDVALIRQEVNRCRDILHSMGRAGKEDLYMQQAPLTTVVEEAASPHLDRGKTVHFETAPMPQSLPQPMILRRAEIVHGLRNLIQNAVDFAKANVWIECSWTEDQISIRVQDDGPGYPSHLIGRIGDPFMRARRSTAQRALRPAYEGMGLGLFIAKTLLERSGAELRFANGTDPLHSNQPRGERGGALVMVSWPVAKIDARFGDHKIEHRENQPLQS
ncbi:ActS/PrrB/RegB family redox-sensitive histidine kinase [Rhodobacteraceae bacterium D3-12]|nr:ActS/PrrB/RegB family redox-sensitive histidine kinase [Rhodobacteraceae bacterium D3-12]